MATAEDALVQVRAGIEEDGSVLRIKFLGGQLPTGHQVPLVEEGEVLIRKEAAVLVGNETSKFFIVIVPSGEWSELSNSGLYVRGCFSFLRAESKRQVSEREWDAFQAL